MTDSITGSRAHSPVRTLGRRWFNLSLAVALAASVAGCGGGSGGDPAAFKAAWAAAPQSALEVIPTLPAPVAASFGNQTVRQIVRASIAGDQARVRFSNLFGTVPLTIGAARVARSVGGSAIDTTSDRELRFAGAATLTLAAGAEAWSDPVDLTVGTQTDLAISTYLPGTVPIVTQHSLGRQENFVVPGNQVSTATVATSDTRQSYFNLTGVDVRATGKTNVVVTFGDSITDGFAATVNQNHRWPDYFARRLQANPGAGTVSVVNVGISGNRILNDVIGPRALDRFDRDVNQTGATHVTILIGINDIGFSSFIPAQAPTVGQITAGLQTLIDKARARGLKVFVATLTPFKGAGYYTEAGETKRAAYNAFVRANATIDGLIDFDAATRNPADPLTLLPAYDSGDHLHPNDAGYEAMANAIALGPFQVR